MLYIFKMQRPTLPVLYYYIIWKDTLHLLLHWFPLDNHWSSG